MAVVFEKTKMLTDTVFHYCPGCNHGIAHRLVAESIEELGLQDNVIGVAPVGCAVFAYDYFNCDMFEAAHGRAPAVATGIKRVHPDTCVFTYQGDGDLASIGTNEIVHGAPIKVCEMLSQIPDCYYAERVALNTTANIMKAKKAIKKAFQYQMEGHGLNIVEVLSTCPTNWGLSPVEAMKWLEDNMIPYYPLGVYKDKGAE